MQPEWQSGVRGINWEWNPVHTSFPWFFPKSFAQRGIFSNSVQKLSKSLVLPPSVGLQDVKIPLSIKNNSWKLNSKSQITSNHWLSGQFCPKGLCGDVYTHFFCSVWGVILAWDAAKPPIMHRTVGPATKYCLAQDVNSANVEKRYTRLKSFLQCLWDQKNLIRDNLQWPNCIGTHILIYWSNKYLLNAFSSLLACTQLSKTQKNIYANWKRKLKTVSCWGVKTRRYSSTYLSFLIKGVRMWMDRASWNKSKVLFF